MRSMTNDRCALRTRPILGKEGLGSMRAPRFALPLPRQLRPLHSWRASRPHRPMPAAELGPLIGRRGSAAFRSSRAGSAEDGSGQRRSGNFRRLLGKCSAPTLSVATSPAAHPKPDGHNGSLHRQVPKMPDVPAVPELRPHATSRARASLLPQRPPTRSAPRTCTPGPGAQPDFLCMRVDTDSPAADQAKLHTV
ncbi:hypothetical protein SAMN05519103_09501 [Rhizobiales bacterium GAS113]|nr:hypothetical protein SAMN05519103_09501 [Rhizobiales bacterium GAS113]